MNFNNSLELTQSQKLIMTTQLKQSLSILNMSKLELEEEIKREAENNPLVEVEKSGEINWEEYIKDMEKSRRLDRTEISYNPDNEVNLENLVKYSSNLYEDLKFQISLYKLTDKQMEVCEYIIDSLDEDGYLRTEEKVIVDTLKIDEEFFEKCLISVQQLEPSGVGARSLSECLMIQMASLGIYNEILEEIVTKDLNLIANNKYKEISKKYNMSLQKCVELINIIKTLDPKPGRTCSVEKSVYIQPDVTVEKIDDEFIVYLNEKDSYQIKINSYYKDILKNSQSDESAKEFIKERLNSATGLMKNIESRKTTVLRIAEEIVKAQDEFLRKGTKYIKPLKMKDIAEKLDFHESTISRGVNGKYMLTPFGVYEFRYFFSSAIETENHEMASSTSIKKIIKETIKDENKKKPLSDDHISKLLKEKGINVARRTVAKYREELGILSSSKRKEF
ncbi:MULTISPECIES: RNA polymerase factor sigma-54 [unclassified Clostridioides]|uniref:RNA polymerase factor sigma-54 n=1 Tax=unclassified Clostridioides TaxID=2635829 RepID=UPI001D113FB6|nr:RNA polymerase factor sigma-54 [Clostridioides sp. ZZV14-6150]MCC0660480.1 RNA polymerase factor sigma-54 [Clostridioides sp. ZZV14-6154]MCC0663850.1 RNA polymerase factor sigma-54 [Clostridioides sp. ZZV15-6597]MCC0669639.1 RNA polymerase factor sigma-54 [Clostridioides sp. ZZV14-6153]MCC0718816.1 RNA polymerase factor sigma-54 [Clostridioides sp. ZZV14-6105]MCC0723326.1 RNA polymerase factor sigma-54 [Clostridioides sp. ZZV14-6104]MCC0726580.1 RNA polymerase factor sigma-54 [Clostridioid